MRPPPQRVVLRNVRQHNLKGITSNSRAGRFGHHGPSARGKSSLAFDQRSMPRGSGRYIESSRVCKQFLSGCRSRWSILMEGLSPAVAIEQKTHDLEPIVPGRTATEINDFLRLLWAAPGPNLPALAARWAGYGAGGGGFCNCGFRNADAECRFSLSFPLPASAHSPGCEVAAHFVRRDSFARKSMASCCVWMTRVLSSACARGRTVLIIVDRLEAVETNRGRLADAVRGPPSARRRRGPRAQQNGDRRRFSEHPACSACGCAAPVLTPTLSVNNPRGAFCPAMQRFGASWEYDESLIVPDPRAPRHRALDPWTKPPVPKAGGACCARPPVHAALAWMWAGKTIPGREPDFSAP